MCPSEAFKRYAEQVCAQIRWKKAHPAVAEEIENHLTDQKNAYLAAGDPESIAEEKALLQMGDPISVGAALDHTHKPASQKGMIALLLALFFAGLLLQFLLADTAPLLSWRFRSPLYFLIVGAVGLAVFFAAYFADFSLVGKYPYLLPVVLVALGVCTRLFGWVINGAHIWLMFGSIPIHAAALALLFPLGFCGVLYRLRQRGRVGFLVCGLLAFACCILLISMCTARGLFLFLFAAGILMIAATKKRWFGESTLLPLFCFIAAGLVLLLQYGNAAYRVARLAAVFSPGVDPSGAGYFPAILQEMVKSSVFLGHGLPLPAELSEILLGEGDILSDYLLLYLAYHYGWAVALLPFALLLTFWGLGLKKCLAQRSVLGQMVSLAILCTFAAEIILYVATNLGFPLIAPISLPFLSYGNAVLMVHMALAGILLSVFRTGEVYRDSKAAQASQGRRVQWADGKLIISFRP